MWALGAAIGGALGIGGAVAGRVKAPSWNYQPTEIDYNPSDFGALQSIQARYAEGPGADFAIRMASNLNRGTVATLQESMNELFSGKGGELAEETAAVVQSQLSGELSESTRRILSRRSLGGASLGRGVTRDSFTYQLGLTTEQQVDRGMNNYRSLYSNYRQALPLATPTQTLNFTAQTMPGFIASSQQDKQFGVGVQKFNEEMNFRNAQAEYAAKLNKAEANAQFGSNLFGGALSGATLGGFGMGNSFSSAGGFLREAASSATIDFFK